MWIVPLTCLRESQAEAKSALVKGLKPKVEIHMLGQHHVNTLAEALEELRVYGHARRGNHTTEPELTLERRFRHPWTWTFTSRAPRTFVLTRLEL